MKSKKIIAGLLALTFVFGGVVLPSGVVSNSIVISASAEISGPYSYQELEDGTIELLCYDSNCTEYDVVIPSEIDGKIVTRIGDSTFAGRKITSVKIPSTITSIGASAFSRCTELKEVVIPSSVKALGRYAFDRCYSLESVTLNDGLSVIGFSAFYYCESLKSIEIPSSVEKIDNYAFEGCTSLKSLKLNSGLKYIGECAFLSCDFPQIEIPDSVEEIGNYAFELNKSLKSVILPKELKTFGYYAFCNCSNLESVNIPDDLTFIPEGTFYECVNLKSIIIPVSVTTIGNNAFTYKDSEKKAYLPIPDLIISCYSGSYAEKYAKENGLKYQLIKPKLTYPTNIKFEYNQIYHQARLTWDKVENAKEYGIAIYQAGKWRIQKQGITTTSYTTPKDLTPGKSYKIMIAAKVDGKWDTANAIKHAVTISIPENKDSDGDGYDDIYDLDPDNKFDYSFLDNEIYVIGMYHDDKNASYLMETISSSSVKTTNKSIDECDDENYFRFKWCGNGYKLYSAKYESNNKVLTINSSGNVVLEEDKDLPSQIWEVLPHELTKEGYASGDGLRFRSKIYYTSDGKPTSYFLSYDGSKLTVTNKDVRNKVKIKSPTEWTRFGELYLNYMGWENTNGSINVAKNYRNNVRIGIDPKENIIKYNGHDLLVNQSGGGFPVLYFNDSPMNEVGCEIIGTYNALVLHDEPVDFYKLAVEFEANATSTEPLGGNGRWGSDPYKIGNCLDAYNVEYTIIDNNLNLNDTIITVDDYSDVDSTNKASCDEFDKELKNGVCGIISYKWPTDGEGYLPFGQKLPKKTYLGIHTYATLYNSKETASPIITFNKITNIVDYKKYLSTYDALKKYDDSGKLKYMDLYLVGYVLK